MKEWLENFFIWAKSEALTLNIRDFVRGSLAAISGAVFLVVYNTVQQAVATGSFVFVFDWNQIKGAAIVAFLGYLQLNFFTKKDGNLGTKD